MRIAIQLFLHESSEVRAENAGFVDWGWRGIVSDFGILS